MTLSKDDILEVMSNSRRRFVFHYLRQRGTEPTSVRQLSEHVAAWELEKDVTELASEDRRRVQTALHQFHLPKMDDLGFVDYDARRGEVKLTEETAQLDIYLDIVPGIDVPWGLYYLGLTGVNVCVLTLAMVGVYPFSLASGLSWALFVVLTFGVSALAHAYINLNQHRYGIGDRPAELDS
ncbi:DUF7344 domain-containing protein [Natrarchaeobaculum aegyptiacum]|nr:hypothetical protein [Natrarchaeobaculum aegyptiacum]